MRIASSSPQNFLNLEAFLVKHQLLVAALLLLSPVSAQAEQTDSSIINQSSSSSLVMEDFNTNSIIYTNSDGKIVIEKKSESNCPNDKLVNVLLDSANLTISHK